MTRTGSLLLADVRAPSCPLSECNLMTGSDAGASGRCTGSLVMETVTWQVSLISDVGSLVLSTSDHAGGIRHSISPDTPRVYMLTTHPLVRN